MLGYHVGIATSLSLPLSQSPSLQKLLQLQIKQEEVMWKKMCMRAEVHQEIKRHA